MESSWSRVRTCVPVLTGGFLTTGPLGKSPKKYSHKKYSYTYYQLFHNTPFLWPCVLCVCARPHGGRVSTSTCRAGGGGLVTKLCPALAIPWTVACQSHLSMGFSRPEYWSGLPFPSLRDLSNPEIEPMSLVSPALAGGFFTPAPPGKPSPSPFAITNHSVCIDLPILDISREYNLTVI